MLMDQVLDHRPSEDPYEQNYSTRLSYSFLNIASALLTFLKYALQHVNIPELTGVALGVLAESLPWRTNTGKKIISCETSLPRRCSIGYKCPGCMSPNIFLLPVLHQTMIPEFILISEVSSNLKETF